MRTLSFALAACLLTLSSAAHGATSSSETAPFQPSLLWPEQGGHWGGFGAPAFKVTSVGGQGAVLTGGRGAALINHTVAFGAGGYWMATSPTVSCGQDCAGELSLYYGGPTINFLFFPANVVHFDVGLMAGFGGAKLEGGVERRSSIFLLEPEANLILNVSEHVRLALGASYRFLLNGRETQLDGVAGTLAVRLGSF